MVWSVWGSSMCAYCARPDTYCNARSRAYCINSMMLLLISSRLMRKIRSAGTELPGYDVLTGKVDETKLDACASAHYVRLSPVTER